MDDQRHEGYRVKIEPVTDRIRAQLGDEILVDSERAFMMVETHQATVFYFPREDVRMDLLQSNPLTTHCPFKGNASYLDYRGASIGTTAGTRNQKSLVAWSYEDGLDEASLVRQYAEGSGCPLVAAQPLYSEVEPATLR